MILPYLILLNLPLNQYKVSDKIDGNPGPDKGFIKPHEILLPIVSIRLNPLVHSSLLLFLLDFFFLDCFFGKEKGGSKHKPTFKLAVILNHPFLTKPKQSKICHQHNINPRLTFI